jgi:hypothetical protein
MAAIPDRIVATQITSTPSSVGPAVAPIAFVLRFRN